MDTAHIRENFDLLSAVEGMVPLRRSGRWYVGPCPVCKDGDDRFNLTHTPLGWRWHCRVCANAGRIQGYQDAISLHQLVWGTSFTETVDRLGSGETQATNPQAELEQAIERARRIKEQLERDLAKAQDALAELRNAKAWERYHQNLTNQTRSIWTYRGVPEFWQDWWQLGYDPCKKVWSKELGREWETPSLTMPIFAPSWVPMQVKHRLLSPPTPKDRYRPERADIPPTLWLSDPSRPVAGPTMLVEGEIKAMVAASRYDDDRVMFAGMPSKNMSSSALAVLKDADPIYLVPDPDTQDQAGEMAEQLGKERTRLVYLPMKIDDAIIEYNLGREWVESLMTHSRRYAAS